MPLKLYQKLVPNYLSPAEFVCLFCENYFIWYFICIAELSKQKIVKIGPHYEYIAYPIKHEENDILDVLEECRIFAQQKSIKIDCENDYWILPLKCLDMFFENWKNCRKLYDLHGVTKANMRVSQSAEFKYLYHKMFMLYEYFLKNESLLDPFHSPIPIPLVEYSEVVKNYYLYTNHILHYCVQVKNKEIDGDRDNSFYFTFIALYRFVKFNDSSGD